MDESEKLGKDVLQGLFEHGLMGIEVPVDYGGAGMGFTSSIVAIEELAKVDPAVSVVCDVQNTLVETVLMNYGSQQLKDKYLPRLASNTVGSFCLSEAESGSDAFALKTTATPSSTSADASSFILNGTKLWITNAGEADIFLVFASLDLSLGYRGITCFAVEKEWGVHVGPKEKKLGIRASSTCPVILDNVKVPCENVVGEIGKGYKIAIEILNAGRIGIAAQMLGLAQGALDITLPYLGQRKQFGNRLIDFQGLQFQLADVATELQAARLLTYEAARKREQGVSVQLEGAMAKLYASRVAEKTASRCVEWMGGIGFTKGAGVEKFFRDAKIGQIYEGTTNIQLQTIAKLVAKEHGL